MVDENQAAVARGVNDLRIEDRISSGQQFAIENHHFEEVKIQVNPKNHVWAIYTIAMLNYQNVSMGTGWDDYGMRWPIDAIVSCAGQVLQNHPLCLFFSHPSLGTNKPGPKGSAAATSCIPT